MIMRLPENYRWLELLELPAELKEALSHYGTLEHKGAGSNVDITNWAKEVGVKGWYPDDDVAWCGLFKGVCAKRAGWLPVPKYDLLSAASWLAWGQVIPKAEAMLGDTLIFSRPGGAHVAYYIGEDATHYCVLGGNQSDSVSFTWIAKDRCMGVRRAKWKVAQPGAVKKVHLNRAGECVSSNEA